MHTTAGDVQRILIALHPGTYVRPHRHEGTDRWSGTETLTALQGAIGAVLFTPQGLVDTAVRVEAGGLVDIPAGQWHTVVCPSDDTVVLEVKAGSAPVPDREWLAGFPPEGGAGSRDMTYRWARAVGPPNGLRSPR
ncbi:WbuC family cupin fold metalloprotein [Kitasatospora sp. NPDC127111]|uniref:WbuC family cupin fold metalloprotein n=1 Tax=Kitasatospora sp. NPDC127111 TaxID=3345363 RepID=UPI00363DC6EA